MSLLISFRTGSLQAPDRDFEEFPVAREKRLRELRKTGRTCIRKDVGWTFTAGRLFHARHQKQLDRDQATAMSAYRPPIEIQAQTFSERASPSAVRSLYGSSSVSNIVLHLRQQFLNNKSSRPIPNRPFEKGRQCECALEDLYGLRIFVLFIEKVAIEVICIQPIRSIRDCFLEIPSGFGLVAEA